MLAHLCSMEALLHKSSLSSLRFRSLSSAGARIRHFASVSDAFGTASSQQQQPQTQPTQQKKRVLSGVQPTGTLHLGNYIGAINQWVTHQDKYQNFFCVVDLHAITVPHDVKALERDTIQAAAFYLAAGIDPKKSTIFVQSQVPAHAELAWLLNCIAPINWLERMVQFKEKTNKMNNAADAVAASTAAATATSSGAVVEDGQMGGRSSSSGSGGVGSGDDVDFSFDREFGDEEGGKGIGGSGGGGGGGGGGGSKACMGLFDYPVLMAADILLYHADLVPVGEDQRQHLELARALCRRFNDQFGKQKRGGDKEKEKERDKERERRRGMGRILTEPVALITEAGARVMSLQDGTSKMSKSDPNENSRINVLDSPDTIAKKIKRCKTDMEVGLEWDNPLRPECTNLLTIFQAVTGKTKQEVAQEVELLLGAQDLYEQWKPARKPPSKSASLRITVRGSNLTYTAPEGLEAEAAGTEAPPPDEGGEPAPPKDLVIDLVIGEADTIVDVNRQIQTSLKQAGATSSISLDTTPYFRALLGPIVSDVPILNFPLSPSIQMSF